MTSPHVTLAELSAADVRQAVDLSALAFTTTADLAPLTALVGQERATQALHMGLSMAQPGYNIFVSGFAGAGARDQIAALLRERAAVLPTPGDWVYVHHFQRPDQPSALALEMNQGLALLTGVPAGDVVTLGTVHGLVNARLQHLAHAMATFGDGSHNGTQAPVDEESAVRE
jgi:hypothetical protein